MNADNKRIKIYPDILEKRLKWLMLAMVTVVFLFLLAPNLVLQPHTYRLGDIAERDIKAPRDFFVEDRTATEANQQNAVEQIMTVYDHDSRMADQLGEKVRTAFARMRQAMAEQAEIATPTVVPGGNATESTALVNTTEGKQQEVENALLAQKEDFESMLGIEVNRGAFRLLINESFAPSIAETIVRIVSNILTNGIVTNKEVLIKEAEKGIILRDVASQKEKTVYSLRQYYGPDQAKTMVRIVAEPLVSEFNYNSINLIVDFSQRLLNPNISLNRNETEERKKKVLAEIKPILYKIKAGEMLLREGERVSSIQLLKLRALEDQHEDKRILTTGLGAAIILITLMFVLHVLYFHQPRHSRLNTSKNLFFMSLVLIVMMVMVKVGVVIAASQIFDSLFSIPSDAIVYAIPVSAGSMLVCLVLGFEIAIPFGLVSAVCASLLFGGRVDIFLYFVIPNAMAAYWVQRCRERKVVISAGTKVGMLNVLLALSFGIYNSSYGGTALLWDGLLAFIGGITACIVTLGIAPLVEMAFRFTTDITLLELANLDRPILRRLMIEAPGTYHHSVIVGSLVEAAANDIGANPLLAKVCGYYHDIGKVKKPLYFIENQTNGRNKHDKLAPSMSSLILIAHVKDGIEIAQKHKLGQIISDTIQQHHGTSLIHYFYEKAKQLKGDGAVKIDDYRYPGPKPQTKEAGLVMLADVVEAASRTLENPTPARIQGLVQHLINKVFSDGQLDNCELTLKDLHNIAKSFNKILYGIHHHRIEYADSGTKESSRVKMAVLIDNQQEKHPIEINSVQKRAQAILNALGSPDGELSLLLVDDPHIASLNEAYLQRQGPTNVIAFPMREGEHGDIHPELLGDVVISMDTCAREGHQAGIDTETRFNELLVHGILHLFGYDHVDSEEEAEVMEAKSHEMLALIKEEQEWPD